MKGLSRRELKTKLGDPSDSTFWRITTEDADFPKPIEFANGRHRIWDESEVDAYLEKRRNAPTVKRVICEGSKRGRKPASLKMAA
ncbi:MAG: AlpA family transcriptional regulator [Desulfuromonadaceae bacterium]|nr:AlpA family transcriptional regulator [Desulfuromonadaceae bacterium]MDD5106293.1 AlpA family transcriptional regulator [Desulfuromonadaceae bacterium]